MGKDEEINEYIQWVLSEAIVGGVIQGELVAHLGHSRVFLAVS